MRRKARNQFQYPAIRTRAGFIYHMGPGWDHYWRYRSGKCSVADNLESVLRKIEYWHQGSIAKFQDHVPGRQSILAQSPAGRETESLFALHETDKRETCKKLLEQK